MRKIIPITLLILLTGCISAQEMELRKKAYCENMGAAQGSPNYYHCRTALEAKLDFERRAAQDQFQRQIDSQNSHVTSPMLSIREPVRCRSYSAGSSINTDCN